MAHTQKLSSVFHLYWWVDRVLPFLQWGLEMPSSLYLMACSHALLFLDAVSPHCLNQPHEPGQSRNRSVMLSSTPQPGVRPYPTFQAAGQCRTYSPNNMSTEVSHLIESLLARKVTTLISLINPIKQQTCLFLYLRNSAISSHECHSIMHFAITWTQQDKNCLPSKAVIFPHCNS